MDSGHRIVVKMAEPADRAAIYRLRHEVYAAELGQHPVNECGILTDPIDEWNVFIGAWDGDEVAGFISVTPPGNPRYSFDKYVERADCPFEVHDRLHEIRLLAVPESRRRSWICTLLMWAAFRWVEANGGTHVVVVGRREVLPMYFKAGLLIQGKAIRCGEVDFELLHTEVAEIGKRGSTVYAPQLQRIKSRIDWQLDFPFDRTLACPHGGQVFEAIDRPFSNLSQLDGFITADVLDAWFPPAPGVVEALTSNPGLLARTSPPVDALGLEQEIAQARGIPTESVLAGAGSSALIHLTLREWLTTQSRVAIVDPTYGEYRHVSENIVGCRVESVRLRDDYDVDLEGLSAAIERGCDLAIIVNPNNPTGRHIARSGLESWLATVPATTRIWIDEAYVEYAGADQSLERFAAASRNVVVCKSMSKAYALSGLRVAYLCGPPSLLKPIRKLIPPWSISLPAHLAAIQALADRQYYAPRYAETTVLREGLIRALASAAIEPVCRSSINAILCYLLSDRPDAEVVAQRCRSRGLLLRTGSSISPRLDDRILRIAVKDEETNRRIVDILREVVKR